MAMLDSPETRKKMDPQIKAEWLAALRSGEYTQGRRALGVIADDGSMSYCCLGVLCDLAEKAGVEVESSVGEARLDGWENPATRVKAYGGGYSTLPGTVKEWAGLGQSNPDVTITLPDGQARETCVASLNDGESLTGSTRQHSFAEIADIIEEQL